MRHDHAQPRFTMLTPRLSHRVFECSERLGLYRWVAVRTLAWFLCYRRLGIYYERRVELLLGLLLLASALICLQCLTRLDSFGHTL